MPSNATPKRIAWLMFGNEVYGVGQAALNLMMGVRAHGVEPMLICFMDDAFAETARKADLQVHILNQPKPPGLPGGLLAKLKALRAVREHAAVTKDALIEACRSMELDVLHVLWPNLVLIAGEAATELGIKPVWEMPNILSDRIPLGLNRRWYRRVCRRFDVLAIANSHYTAASLGSGTKVMHLGIDDQRFDPQTTEAVDRSSLGIDADIALTGIFARLAEQKGQRRIVEAIASHERLRDNLALLLLGADDTEKSQQLQAIADTHSYKHLHLRPRVENPQQYYPMLDFAINARTDAEPYGLSVVEAMMMGKPIMVHALGGPGETVLDGETGWHVADASVEAFQTGLLRVLEDRDNWQHMGAAAREHALQHFAINRVAAYYLELLQEST